MKTPEQMTGRSWARGTLRTLLVVAIPATLAIALPTGYREDFNGCSTQQDQAKRKTCCDEVARDCHAVCDTLHGDAEIGPGGWVICGMDCDAAKDSCGSGSTIEERIDWPGQPGLQIPGVFIDDNRIVTEEGIGLGVSTRSTVIEIRSDEAEREPSACTAAVTSCECPLKGLEYEAVGKECRPVVTSGVVECRICPTGESATSCKTCDACTPVILSVRPCAHPRPGRQKASGG